MGMRAKRSEATPDVLHALLDSSKRLQGFFAETRQHIERQLRVEYIGFSFWKEGAPDLLCDSSRPRWPRSLAGSNTWTTDRRIVGLVFEGKPSQKHREGDGGGMCDHLDARVRMLFRRVGEGRAQPRFGLLLKPARQIDQDRTPSGFT